MIWWRASVDASSRRTSRTCLHAARITDRRVSHIVRAPITTEMLVVRMGACTSRQSQSH